jgi:hypothetical protein
MTWILSKHHQTILLTGFGREGLHEATHSIIDHAYTNLELLKLIPMSIAIQ